MRRAPLVAFCLAVAVLWPSIGLFVRGDLAGVALAQRAALALIGASIGVRLLAAAMTSTRVTPPSGPAPAPAPDAPPASAPRRRTDRVPHE